MRGEPCYCGAHDCRWCYPGTWKTFRAREAHADHDNPDLDMADCPECVADADAAQAQAEAKYDAWRQDRWDR